MRPFIRPTALGGFLAILISACGADDERGAPPPVVGGESDTTFALESGKYYVEQLRDLQDGCGKNPMASSDPITQVPFILANSGDGAITIDFCSDQGRSVQGSIRGNRGTLSVIHNNRRQGEGEFSQECHIDLTVTEDNKFQGRYVEIQRNRNQAMRLATVNVPECTTSSNFTMIKSDSPHS